MVIVEWLVRHAFVYHCLVAVGRSAFLDIVRKFTSSTSIATFPFSFDVSPDPLSHHAAYITTETRGGQADAQCCTTTATTSGGTVRHDKTIKARR